MYRLALSTVAAVAFHRSVSVFFFCLLAVVVAAAAVGHEFFRTCTRRSWDERLHFFQSIVDTIAATLLGDFVGCALAGQTGRKRIRVGDAREMIALEKVLII
jgi:hypothetical protein